MVDVVTVSIGVVQLVGAVQWVDSGIVLLPRAGVAGLPTVRQCIAVRVDVIGVGSNPVGCCLRGLSVSRQTLAKNGLQQISPHVLAEITQTIAVGVLVLV